MNLTKEEAIRLHRKLWGWLAENPEAEKQDWPGWKKDYGFNPDGEAHCFCCAYARQFIQVHCHKCPLTWPEGGDCMFVIQEWDETHRLTERTRIATIVRDLPVKEDVHATK